ncbi:MAG TPA: branched-chain amino acid ABC transporter substrate-binding protein [bacterium]|nr:branched-chain amino acid ABC transporter substrate-binding protein [bacterium]
MVRLSKTIMLVLCAVLATGALFVTSVPAAQMGPVNDPIGVVKVGPGEPITIAYWLVTSGSDGSLGTDSKRGIEIAIDDLHGKFMGHDIKLIGEDSGCNAEGGQTAATKIAANASVVVAIGSSCSSEAVPGAPILWKAGIATVSPSNTAPLLTDPKRGPDFDGYLRVVHNDKVQGAAAATFVRTVLKLNRVATIHDGSPYAEGLTTVFAESFKKQGGTITAQEAVAPTDTDMRPLLTRIASTKPDMLYYPIFIAAGGFITRQSREIEGLKTVTLMGADGLDSPDFAKAAGDAAKGMYLSSPDLTPAALGPRYGTEFLPKYQKKYGQKPISGFHAHAYDATMVIFAAIKKVAKADGGSLYIGRKALRDALFATKGFKGITGTLTCNPYGDCGDPHIAVYQVVSANPATWSLGTDPKKIWPLK